MTRAYWPLLFAGLLAGASQAAPYPNVYGAPPEVLRSTDWYRQCLRVKNEKPVPPALVANSGTSAATPARSTTTP